MFFWKSEEKKHKIRILEHCKIPRGTLGGGVKYKGGIFLLLQISPVMLNEIVSQAGCPAFRQTNSVRTLARISEHCD